MQRAEARGVHIETILGDARITLDMETPQDFDVLVLDAFAGDAIPVHLITCEAFQIYRRHLAPDGVIALHISNGHLDLLPMALGMAKRFDLEIGTASTKGSTWVLLSRAGRLSDLIAAEPGRIRVPPANTRVVKPWTDSFSNLLECLK